MIQTNHIKTSNGPVPNLTEVNSSWNELSSGFNERNSNFNSVNSSINSMNPSLVGENGDGDNDDDDGWEFRGADSKPQVGDDKVTNLCLSIQFTLNHKTLRF